MACALPGCNKPTSGTHLACGEHHHFLLMDSRYSSCRSKQPLLHQKPPHLCAFSPCSLPPSPGHRCCSKRHYLSWLQRSYSSLRPDQICKLPDCCRHVFVESHNDGSFEVYDFCGWKHCQQFYIRNALRSFEEKCMGHPHEPSVESLMDSLKDYVRGKSNALRTIQVDENFFNRHPWEVMNRPDVEYCWLIARCIWKEKDSSKRELITKDNYHWKQQGKPSSYSNEISKRYLTYTKLGRKKGGSNESDEVQAFTMLEYTWVGAGNFKDYCVVKLCRGRVQSQARKRARLNIEDEDAQSNNKQACIGNPAEDSNDNHPVHNWQGEDVVDSNNEQASNENPEEDAVDRNPDQPVNYWAPIPEICNDSPRNFSVDCGVFEHSWPKDCFSDCTDSVLAELQWLY